MLVLPSFSRIVHLTVFVSSMVSPLNVIVSSRKNHAESDFAIIIVEFSMAVLLN